MRHSTVLIVAQSPFQLALMSDLLEANDIRTLRAADAREAVSLARSELPIMVVLDLDLAADESRRVVDGLKRIPMGASIPVMVVGDKSQREICKHILKEFSAEEVEKPIDTSAFPRRVIQEIRRHTTQAGAREAPL